MANKVTQTPLQKPIKQTSQQNAGKGISTKLPKASNATKAYAQKQMKMKQMRGL